MTEPSLALELGAEYFQLWKLADAMYRMLLDAGVDFCAEPPPGTCPPCVARRRFAPRRPCVALRTSVLEG